MESPAVAALVGVVVGFLLGAGTKARAIVEAVGDERMNKLMDLLELLNEPEDDEANRRPRRRR